MWGLYDGARHCICTGSVENALGITVPDNARLLRNLIEGAQLVQDHVIHFYHLHALDWVDIVSALSADANATSDLAQSLSDWPNSSPAYFAAARDRLQSFVGSGQLGIFANGYWGHPAYKLPPAANLMAVAHYLEALDWQREYIKIHALLGGKNPHPQSYLVGGMTLPVDPNSSSAINPNRIAQLKSRSEKALGFVSKVYIPDLIAVASFYPEWANLGGGTGNFLSFGDFPTNTDENPADLWLPRGVVTNKDLQSAPQAVDHLQIQEFVTHSWYFLRRWGYHGYAPLEGRDPTEFHRPTAAVRPTRRQ